MFFHYHDYCICIQNRANSRPIYKAECRHLKIVVGTHAAASISSNLEKNSRFFHLLLVLIIVVVVFLDFFDDDARIFLLLPVGDVAVAAAVPEA